MSRPPPGSPTSTRCRPARRITRTLLPIIERAGIATAAEVGIETLAERLRAEAVALDATLVTPAFIGAWTRTAAIPA
ncbi:MAG TPA: hypothetical protein VFI42_15750 [Thermomicrobiaceae bacterium]|nr:hypothetical protein [Thermomicrobiaceae bacterium]